MKIKYKDKSGKRQIMSCNKCNEEFETLSVKVRAGGELFCSTECYNNFRSDNSNKKENHIKHQRMYKYGLNEESYNKMVELCNNSCEICEKPFANETRYTTSCVDHNHNTNHVRGLLCHQCNKALGGFKDNIDLIKKAIIYLENKDITTN